jgi:hypothetical protein
MTDFRPSLARTLLWWPVWIAIFSYAVYYDVPVLQSERNFSSFLYIWFLGSSVIIFVLEITLIKLHWNTVSRRLLGYWMWFYEKTPHYKKRAMWRILRDGEVPTDKGWMSFS